MKKQKNKVLKEGFMQAVLSLMFSQVLIKLLGLIYNLYLTNKDGFGDQGNAIYSGSYQIYALLLTLSSIGVPNAISKLVAERTAKGDHKGAIRIFKVALATFALIGLAGTLLLFLGADFIATHLLNIPEAKYTLVTLSPAVFFVTAVLIFQDNMYQWQMSSNKSRFGDWFLYEITSKEPNQSLSEHALSLIHI